MAEISKLHTITLAGQHSYVEQVSALCEAGAKWIQLRCKELSHKDFVNQAIIAKDICKKTNTILIVNDSIDACTSAKADGIHIGKSDLNPQIVRNVLGSNKIIGYTINSLEQAKQSESLLKLVDYIGVGPFKPTTTKENHAEVLSAKEIKEIIDFVSPIPVVVIGGVLTSDVEEIAKLNAHGIAVAGAICAQENIKEAFKNFESTLQKFIPESKGE